MDGLLSVNEAERDLVAAELERQPFFKDFDFHGLVNGTLKPPHVPKTAGMLPEAIFGLPEFRDYRNEKAPKIDTSKAWSDVSF